MQKAVFCIGGTPAENLNILMLLPYTHTSLPRMSLEQVPSVRTVRCQNCRDAGATEVVMEAHLGQQ